MKKKVNGTVVDIGNLELFLLADQGNALCRKASSLVCDTIENESELVRDIVQEYNSIVSKLVFPLLNIETEIKYVTIAEILRHNLKDKYGIIEMDVKDYIAIEVEPDTILKLMGQTWGIEATSDSYRKRARVCLDDYSNDDGYLEYKWVKDQLMQGKGTDGYYKEFMGDFVKACKGEDFLLRWELSHILDFGYLPEETQLVERSIIDFDSMLSYSLDIYAVGTRKTSDTLLKVTVGSDGKASTSMENKEVKIYNFEAYVKSLTALNNRIEKVKNSNTSGFASIFEQVLGEGIGTGTVNEVSYKGVIIGDQIVFELEKSIFICPFNSYEVAKRLLCNVQFYGYSDNTIYVKKRERKASKVWRETIYSYELETAKARLCRIQHVKL